MATKYSVRWCFEGKDSESIALLSDAVPHESIIDFIDSLRANAPDWDSSNRTLQWVDCIDMETGEVICCLQPGWDDEPEDEDTEPDNIDDDCGFDPYMGCYTDDC